MTSLDRRLPAGFLAEALRDDARAGLTSDPKSLPPKWFYDAQGSALFDKITELPEYYPTRPNGRSCARTRPGSPARRGPGPWWNSARDLLRRPGCCSTRSRRRARCAATYRST